MSEAKGKLLTCDRCGKTTFLKFIESGCYDGGFGDRYEKFEDQPDTWSYVCEVGLLCDVCTSEYRHRVADFMNGKVHPSWREKENEDNK